jgi:hypothetical protein
LRKASRRRGATVRLHPTGPARGLESGRDDRESSAPTFCQRCGVPRWSVAPVLGFVAPIQGIGWPQSTGDPGRGRTGWY